MPYYEVSSCTTHLPISPPILLLLKGYLDTRAVERSAEKISGRCLSQLRNLSKPFFVWLGTIYWSLSGTFGITLSTLLAR